MDLIYNNEVINIVEEIINKIERKVSIDEQFSLLENNSEINPMKKIHTYVLYIYEDEKNKFNEQKEKSNVKLDFEFYLGTNGYVFKQYFRDFLRKRISEVKDNPIFQRISEIINHKKFYLKNEKQLGHIRSFINIIRNAKKNKYKKICILESDVIFIKDFEKKIRIYDEVIKSSSLFYLGSNDKSISITTNLFLFDKKKSYDKIKKKKPNLSEEELLKEVEKKRLSNLKKRSRFSDLIKRNDEYFINERKYIANCPYGTFAMIIDEKIYDKILEVLDLQVYPTDVLFFYMQDILDEKEWCVSFPNLLIADVTHSYILQERHQEKFAEGRGWKLEDYHM